MIVNVNHVMVQLKRLECMHQLATGATTGGTLALVLRLLACADHQPVLPAASQVCEAFGSTGWRLDYPSFVLGLTAGIFLYLVIEFALNLPSRCGGPLWLGLLRFEVVAKPIFSSRGLPTRSLHEPRVQGFATGGGLREEVESLRGELARLRRAVTGLRAGESLSSVRESDWESEDSYSLVSEVGGSVAGSASLASSGYQTTTPLQASLRSPSSCSSTFGCPSTERHHLERA